MSNIHVETERETAQGWDYRVRLEQNGRVFPYQVSLSWADYDLWCHGRLPPQRVIHAIMAFLLDREPPQAILQKFDCALVRRYFPQVDQELKQYLSPGTGGL